MSEQRMSKSGDERVSLPAGTHDHSQSTWKLVADAASGNTFAHGRMTDGPPGSLTFIDCKYEKPTTSGLSRQQNCSQLTLVNCRYEKPTPKKTTADQREAA